MWRVLNRIKIVIHLFLPISSKVGASGLSSDLQAVRTVSFYLGNIFFLQKCRVNSKDDPSLMVTTATFPYVSSG